MIHILDDETKDIEREIDRIILACPIISKNHNLLMSVVGLTLRLNESGSFKGKTTLGKICPSQIRSKIFLVAVSASKYNPDIKAQKHHLLSARKTKMQALGTAMRKLIQICFRVIKNQTKYQSGLALN